MSSPHDYHNPMIAFHPDGPARPTSSAAGLSIFAEVSLRFTCALMAKGVLQSQAIKEGMMAAEAFIKALNDHAQKNYQASKQGR